MPKRMPISLWSEMARDHGLATTEQGQLIIKKFSSLLPRVSSENKSQSSASNNQLITEGTFQNPQILAVPQNQLDLCPLEWTQLENSPRIRSSHF